MLPHHKAWLDAHPDRTGEWLQRRLSDGFDVHHLDADHQNNEPHNLVLIEHEDHMRLHKLNTVRAIGRKAELFRLRKFELGGDCYALRKTGETWAAVERSLFDPPHTRDGLRAVHAAKTYAQNAKEAWPLLIRRGRGRFLNAA